LPDSSNLIGSKFQPNSPGYTPYRPKLAADHLGGAASLSGLLQVARARASLIGDETQKCACNVAGMVFAS
jgi:hypothetical protein